MNKGFDFLRFRIQRCRKEGRASATSTRPAEEVHPGRQGQGARADEQIRQEHADPVLLMKLNSGLQGWANDFRRAVAKRVFSAIDSYA